MKAKALSQFYTKLRYNDEKATLVSIGQVIEGDDDNLRALARNRMVDLMEDGGEMAAKPAKGKAMVGKTEPAPLAGKGEGVQMPAPDGTETLPPVKSAPKGGEGKE